jgi:flagellar FliL protein
MSRRRAGANRPPLNQFLTTPRYCRAITAVRAALFGSFQPMTDQALEEDLPASEGEAEQEAAPRFSRKKLMMFGAAGLGVLLLTGGGLYTVGALDRFIGHKEEVVEKPAAPKPAVFFDLPDLLVNLNAAGRKASFLKLSVSLELEKQEDVARLQAVMPRIIDNFQVYLRELRVEDLRGSGGIYRLREELLSRVNAAAAPAHVADVLFKELLVQ